MGGYDTRRFARVKPRHNVQPRDQRGDRSGQKFAIRDGTSHQYQRNRSSSYHGPTPTLTESIHSGIVTEGGEDEASAWSAGVAAVQRAALTTWDWATLLQRVWGVDALKCEGCGGRMKFIAVIKDRAVIERILKHLGEEAEETRFARARDPCDAWD